MSGGLTPCRQLRPSSRREHVSNLYCCNLAEPNKRFLLGVDNIIKFRVVLVFTTASLSLSGGFTPSRHLRPSSEREQISSLDFRF